MGKVKKTVLAIILALVLIFAAGCGSYNFSEETGGYIVTAKQALNMMDDGAILAAACPADEYAGGHIAGAVSVPMGALTVDEPYKNMLPDEGQVEDVMGAAGITEKDTLLVYDNNNNMQAARVQWTLNMYSNFNVKVVSGGFEALQRAGAQVESTPTTLPAAAYAAGDKQKKRLANLKYLNLKLDEDDGSVIVIDTRSAEEYTEGTIPGSVHIEYVWNNYGSGEYKSVRDLQSTYINKGLLPDPEKTYILFCKTSVRAAQTYTAMMDMGFENVRIYDGAWLEYSDVQDVPDEPTETTVPVVQDAS